MRYGWRADSVTSTAWKLTIVTFVVVVGCAGSSWHKPGATVQDFEREKYVCAAQAGYYLPNPYSPLTLGSNDPSWGLNSLLYQWGQKRQFNDCMKAHGWTEAAQTEPAQGAVQEQAKQALPALRALLSPLPVCGFPFLAKRTVILAVSQSAQ